MSVPKYRLDAIETIGRKILQEYDPVLLDGPPQAVPIETIIETKFDLTLEYHCLRKNGSILGETIFDEGAAILYAWELGAQDADTGLIYLQSFAPDMDLQEFEERVCCVMENRMLVDVIDRALLRLKRYPDRGELYYEILTKQFIHRFNSTEKELLDELNMERSVFYDRKREAIFLLSLCLFGYAVPELQEELEMPRLYPD